MWCHGKDVNYVSTQIKLSATIKVAVWCLEGQSISDILIRKPAWVVAMKQRLYGTHHCLMTWQGKIELGQHWFRLWLAAWWYEAIASVNIDLLSTRICGIHLRVIPLQGLVVYILHMGFKLLIWYYNRISFGPICSYYPIISSHGTLEILATQKF